MRSLVGVGAAALVLASGCGGSAGGRSGGTIIVSASVGVVSLDAQRPGGAILPNPLEGVDDAALSADGKAIAWTNNEQLFVTDAKGEHLRMVAPTVDDSLWEWSPDSQRLAWDYNDISVARADGSDRRKLVKCASECGLPAWSPDSKRLAVEERGGLELVDVHDGQTRQLVRCVLAHCAQPACGGACGSAAWTPDGKLIAFAEQAERPHGCGLGIVASDGRDARTIAQPTGNRSLCITVSWSPDGHLLAVERFEPSAVGLYRRSGSDVRLVRVVKDVDTSAWSPDGKRLAYLRNGSVLWLADAKGEHPRRIGLALEYAWSPDGTELAVAHGRANPATGPGPTVIWIVDADSGAHRQIWPRDGGSCVCGEPDWRPK
jgi:Tol biopolymer transport system component